MYCHSVLLISIDFYDLYIPWMFKSIQNHQSPSLEVGTCSTVHSRFIPSSTGWLIQVVSDFPPICHGNFGEFRHMLQHLAHLPKHPQIICFLLCLWCLCSYLINIIKHDTL
jgi:hypothetical protein